MQHLETERIAAFDHEAPSIEELAHLAACTACRTERNAFSALNQRSMHMADAPAFPPAPRLTNWESLSLRLRAEGLMTGEASVGAAPLSDGDAASNEVRFENVLRALNNAAPSIERNRKASQPIAMESWLKRAKPRTNGEFFRAVAAVLLFAVTGAGINQIRNDRLGGASEGGTQSTASLGPLDFGNTGFNSIDQATKALATTEREFDRISTWITANDPSANKSDILRKRLAALDRVMAASYAEWRLSPQDRVLDHYYRSAYAARELTLKQLGGALPVGRSLERF